MDKPIVPEIMEPEYISSCEHEDKWQTCRVCNDDFCKICWEQHDEGEFICQEN